MVLMSQNHIKENAESEKLTETSYQYIKWVNDVIFKVKSKFTMFNFVLLPEMHSVIVKFLMHSMD